MRHLDDGLEVRDVVARVADALNVHGLGLVVDGSRNVVGVVAVDELGLDAQAGEEHLELVVRAAVQVGGRNNVVAGMCQSKDGERLRRLATARGNSSYSALESSDPLLENVDGGAVRGARVSTPFPCPQPSRRPPLTSLSWSRCCRTP